MCCLSDVLNRLRNHERKTFCFVSSQKSLPISVSVLSAQWRSPAPVQRRIHSIFTEHTTENS